MNHKFGTIVLLGPPNAGKSSLMNNAVGEKVAIVTPKPQTTRNRISGIWTAEDVQAVFLDTPGIHTRRGKLNRFLLQSAWQALAASDAILVVLDAALYADKPGAFERDLKPLEQPVGSSRLPVLVAANKVDLVGNKAKLLAVLARIGEMWPQAEIFPISAVTGEGVPELLGRLKELLPDGPPAYPEDQISTAPLRFMAAEIIREKLFLRLKEELPYLVAVEIENWEEGKKLTRIEAVVYCARDNHKAIIIGRAGQGLKDTGAQARAEIEELLGKQVFLGLFVKVKPDWTEDGNFLRSMGFGE